MSDKPRLLILSAVYPFPRASGQQQRVYYKLCALRAEFHLTFMTIADRGDVEKVRQKLLELCDEAIVLPSRYTRNLFTRVFYKALGTMYALYTGLKFSNYQIGEVELSPWRLATVLTGTAFDGALFEYWHAFRAADFFRRRHILTVLDMHDILWRSFTRQLDARKFLPGWLKRWWVARYKACEESAWNAFDILIAINQDEYDYVNRLLGQDAELLHAPMGTDISVWHYCWQPAFPQRIAYYGGLASRHNQQDAMLCYREIMPAIWEQYPDTEFWIVGSNPPAYIKDLEQDERVHVTGFLERPQDVLSTVSLVLCPWSGTYGFRSRVVEVMALGVPVIASSEAVQGMGFDIGHGIALGQNSTEMVHLALDLLQDRAEHMRQSRLARQQIEEKFSYETTYVRLSKELAGNLS